MTQYDKNFVNAIKLLDNLIMDHRFTNFFDAPINKELLSHQLSMIQSQVDEDDSSSTGRASGSRDSGQSYHDFLLPLPDSLIPTETGMIHPDVVNSSQAARGLNTKMDSNHRKTQEKLNLKQKLQHKQKLKQNARPRIGLTPTPFGTTKKKDD